MSLNSLEWVRNSLIWCASSLPKGSHERSSSACAFSYAGKAEYVSDYLASLDLWDIAKGANFSLLPSEYWIMSYMTRDQEESGRAQIGLSGGVKQIWILVTLLQTPSRCLPMSHWECLTFRYPSNWPTATSSAPCIAPTHTSTSDWLPVCMHQAVAMRVSFGTWLVSMCRKLTQIYRPGRDHKLSFSATFGKIQEMLSALRLLCCNIQRSHTSLRILPQERARNMEQVYL